MRFNLKILTIVALAFAASCDVLDQTPQQSLPTEDIFTNEANVNAVLAGAYSGLQGSLDDNIRFTELAGDNARHTGSFPSWAAVDQHNLLADNAEGRNQYIALYDVINTANNIIKFTSDVESMPEARQNIAIAEAKVIRALAYHNLVRWYGGVPLMVEPIEGLEEGNVPRSTAAEVYTLITQDLEDAVATLGASGTSGSTRITGYAATALLARVNLYTGDYPAAEANATTVINSGNFAVTGVLYSANFGVAEADGQGSGESIFELLFTDEDSNSLSFFARPNGNGGRFEYGPEPTYSGIYDAADTRISSNLRTYSGALRLGKYFRTDGSDNFIIVRLAEMYLIRAEAIARQDFITPVEQQAAIADVNVIRDRAGLADVTIADFANFEAFLDEVLLQKRIELDQEGHRWHDLVRTGRAQATLGITDANDLLWPIPQREIDSNSAIAPEDQNPGY